MNLRQRQQIVSSQRYAWKRHGYHPHALFWSSREIQQLRFRIIQELADFQPRQSLLDVGCGFGDLWAWLQKQGLDPVYTGIDLSADLLEEGQRRFPGAAFFEGDLFDFDPPEQAFDWVVLSGALNRDLQDNGAYARQVIERMYLSCRRGIVFNLLDARDQWVANCWDLQSFQPDQMVAWLRSIAAHVEVRDQYLENDFSVLARRER